MLKTRYLLITLLYCFMSSAVMPASGRPTIMLKEGIHAKDTPKRVILYYFNWSNHKISYGRFYRIEHFRDGEWVDIEACGDYPDDGFTIRPYGHSTQIITIPLCKKGLYRVSKDVESNNQTLFIAYEFQIY